MKINTTIKYSILVIISLAVFNSANAQFTGGIGSGYAKNGKINTTLPVHFISVEAKNENKFVKLTWKVENEINIKKYHVERSKNGQDYIAIGSMSQNGTSTSFKEYNYIDYYPELAVSFYRIKEEDNDGEFTYSQVIKVYYLNNEGPSLFPNPASSFICINNISLIENHSSIVRIFNTNGQIVKELSTSFPNLSVNISALSKGTYYLSIENIKGISYKTAFEKQ